MNKRKTTATKPAAPPPPPGVADAPVAPERPSRPTIEDVQVTESTIHTVTGGKVTINAPLLVLSGYAMRRLDVRLNSNEADGWKAMAMGLEREEARLKDGKYIRTATDAVRWVGERLATSLDIPQNGNSAQA